MYIHYYFIVHLFSSEDERCFKIEIEIKITSSLFMCFFFRFGYLFFILNFNHQQLLVRERERTLFFFSSNFYKYGLKIKI